MLYAFVKQILCFLFCASAVITCQIQMLLVADISFALPSNQRSTMELKGKKKKTQSSSFDTPSIWEANSHLLLVSSFYASYFYKCNKLFKIFVWLSGCHCQNHAHSTHSSGKFLRALFFLQVEIGPLCGANGSFILDGGKVDLYCKAISVWHFCWMRLLVPY